MSESRVLALLLFCEACGMRVRVGRDDYETFAAFYLAHLLPTIDAAVLDDGRCIEVVAH